MNSSKNPSLRSVTCVTADTEYAVPIEKGSKQVTLRTNHLTADFRLAFQTGAVATPTEPYISIANGREYFVTDINMIDGDTWYVASTVDNTVIVIETWS